MVLEAINQAKILMRRLAEHCAWEGEHARRVSVYSAATGDRLGLSEDDLLDLRFAAELHDIGLLHTPVQLLQKEGPLSVEDRQTLCRHPLLGASDLAARGGFTGSIEAVRQHHERWDGSGYPEGIDGEELCVEARILGLAEAFDYMTMPPPWAQRVPEGVALEEIRSGSGTLWDPQVVEAFLAIQPIIQPVGL